MKIRFFPLLNQTKALVFTGLLFVSGLLQAFEPVSITFKTERGESVLSAEEIKGRIYVDFIQIAQILEVKTVWKHGSAVFEFPSYSLAVSPRKSIYSTLEKGKKKWMDHRFERHIYADRGQLMIPLSDLPQLIRRSLSYHRQKKILTEEPAWVPAKEGALRTVSIGTTVRDHVLWVSLDDAAKAFNCILYSEQSRLFKLVMTDFSILELRVGEKSIYRRENLYIQLDDPVLLFSGKPYISLRSVQPLFDVDATWDAARKVLLVPVQRGRFRQAEGPIEYKLTMIGYKPEPFHLRLEEASFFYQDPIPTYSADHRDVYESVRDFLSNDAIRPEGNAVDHASGEALLDLKGNTFGIPLEGRGSFEKIGTKSHVVSASAKWGFPLFQISGGREFSTMNNLNNQFNIVDQVTLSHSNDSYGDNDVSPRLQFQTSYGRTKFSVFQSTALFSQNAVFEQRYEMGGVEAEWKLPERKKIGLSLEHYFFQNEVRSVSSSFYEEDLFRDIFGDGYIITVDPNDQQALLKTTLPDRHMTTLLNLNFAKERAFDVSGVLGVSSYKDEVRDKRITDTDWLLRTTLWKGPGKIDLSYENAGDHYRSMGNPLRYQDRRIWRAAPSLSLFKFWKVFGELKREDTGSLESQGIAPYTNYYKSATNLFAFSKNSARASYTEFDSTLYGRRQTWDAGVTHFFGPDSIDIGGDLTGQWGSNEIKLRTSKTGRISYQIIRPVWKLSLGQDYTHHYYDGFNFYRIETQSRLLFRVKGWETMLNYHREPKYFLDPATLYTGYIRLGYSIVKDKVLSVFGSISSLNNNFSHPDVWRAGIEYGIDFY